MSKTESNKNKKNHIFDIFFYPGLYIRIGGFPCQNKRYVISWNDVINICNEMFLSGIIIKITILSPKSRD